MEKRRVYQVAKEQKLSSDALISMLKGMGHDVKSHMSVVTENMLQAITHKIEEEKQSSIQEVKRQKEKEEVRKKEQANAAATRKHQDSEASRVTNKRTARSGGARVGISREFRPEAPLPTKDDDDRRRKRRDRRDGEPVTQPRSEGAPPSHVMGGRGRNKRRPKVDRKTARENVRKTLTQLGENRTRKRYERVRKDGDEDDLREIPQLTIGEFVAVSDLAEQMGVKPTDVIGACLQLGLMVTINQRLDMDTIITVADEFGFEVVPMEAEKVEEFEEIVEEEEVGEPHPRPPVVTVMGHVDHGKTSLLDRLRDTNVAEGESGGITQHIGAYVVQVEDGRRVTFLDTPGHAAFTAMRARGARVTDIVVLIVAADDSVMPQTIEAIDHAKAAQVPIIVAINKVDLPASDPDRIKRELSERDVLVEQWGGKVSCAEISAKTGQNIDNLLELILLEADLLELKAIPEKRARGTIVEAKLDKGRGPVATVLVQDGTLRKGDPFITGVYNGRVRALLDDAGLIVEEATPSIPVQVLGGTGIPQAGDSFVVTVAERDARELSQKRQQLKREQEYRNIRGVSLSDLHYQIQQGAIKDLKVIVKGDVDGSVEAVAQELGGITHEEVRVAVIHSSVGAISESDVLLASASNAIIIGFRVQPEASAREMAEKNGVEIRHYKVIYEVLEEVKAALTGLLAPSLEERLIGSLEVREIFSSSRMGTIAGCMVNSGKITRNHKVRIVREGEVLFKGGISSLRRFKDDVREVLEGFECGVGVEGFEEILAGDKIEVVEVIETARTLEE